MLQSLFRRAEAKVDDAISHVLMRVLVALPFLVAAGFGTAALAIYAYDHLGILYGNLFLAAAFSMVGLMIAAIVAVRGKRARAGQAVATVVDEEAPGAKEEGGTAFDPVEREVLGAVASAVGPLALPLILRPLLRNLPLVAAIAAAGFVLTRPTSGASELDPDAMQPAE